MYVFNYLLYNSFIILQFNNLYEEVSECLNVAVEVGHLGVVQALSSACQRLSAQQGLCIKVQYCLYFILLQLKITKILLLL